MLGFRPASADQENINLMTLHHSKRPLLACGFFTANQTLVLKKDLRGCKQTETASRVGGQKPLSSWAGLSQGLALKLTLSFS